VVELLNIKNTIFEKDSYGAVDAIDALLVAAVDLGASDIHADPLLHEVLIRFRIDGMVNEVFRLRRSIHEEFIARLKILSGTRTDVHLVPQDGRWKALVSGREYHIRISFMPTYNGENAVMRILPVERPADISFSNLGFIPDHVHAIESAISKNHGLILSVGPTGSGKTTTLNACLSLLSKEPISIITLEDPVEYEIRGVRQVHIRHAHGVTFASGLRASLRQDPDVIMVGEIRDNETARVAIHTALTGHLVFSTLHTNSALETIPRLIDMGVDHYLLASTLKLVIGQRLVRTLCGQCQGKGCDICHSSGYRGRTTVAEVCEIDKGLSDLISKNKPLSEYVTYSESSGFRTILDDGLEKVEWGVTTKEEVIRALDN
jgi:type IV pilus assembly protein PilB